MPHSYDRTRRVAELIQRHIAQSLQTASDPRFSKVTVLGVKVTRDYANADIFVSVIEEVKSTLAALNKASGYFRKLLAENTEMRKVPKLTFIYDDTIERGQRLDQLINDL